MAHAGLIGAAAIALAACATEATPPPKPQATPAATAPVEFSSSRWGVFQSERFNVRMTLPDGAAWKIDDHGASWLVATHAPTSSALALRVWSDDNRMNREKCEAKAREARKLPDRERAEIVEKRAISFPPDFDTVMEVGLVPPPQPGGPLDAFVLAFGGRAHRCFAYVFTTRAAGKDAEAVIGERLAAIVARSVQALVVRSELEPTVREEANPLKRP